MATISLPPVLPGHGSLSAVVLPADMVRGSRVSKRDPWPTTPGMTITHNQVIYIIGHHGNAHVVLARFVVSRHQGHHTITIHEIRLEPLMASSYPAVGTVVNHLLLGTILGHEIQQTGVKSVSISLSDPSALPWSEYGFQIRNTEAIKEFETPGETKITLNTCGSHCQSLVVHDDAKEHATMEKQGPLIWRRMEALANEFVWSKEAADDIHCTFSRLRKDLRCRTCRLHYSMFWNEHPLKWYLTEEENDGGRGMFTVRAWVNKCHNSVNVIRGNMVFTKRPPTITNTVLAPFAL